MPFTAFIYLGRSNLKAPCQNSEEFLWLRMHLVVSATLLCLQRLSYFVFLEQMTVTTISAAWRTEIVCTQKPHGETKQVVVCGSLQYISVMHFSLDENYTFVY